jgi:hypothetical protein
MKIQCNIRPWNKHFPSIPEVLANLDLAFTRSFAIFQNCTLACCSFFWNKSNGISRDFLSRQINLYFFGKSPTIPALEANVRAGTMTFPESHDDCGEARTGHCRQAEEFEGMHAGAGAVGATARMVTVKRVWRLPYVTDRWARPPLARQWKRTGRHGLCSSFGK